MTRPDIHKIRERWNTSNGGSGFTDVRTLCDYIEYLETGTIPAGQLGFIRPEQAEVVRLKAALREVGDLIQTLKDGGIGMHRADGEWLSSALAHIDKTLEGK